MQAAHGRLIDGGSSKAGDTTTRCCCLAYPRKNCASTVVSPRPNSSTSMRSVLFVDIANRASTLRRPCTANGADVVSFTLNRGYMSNAKLSDSTALGMLQSNQRGTSMAQNSSSVMAPDCARSRVDTHERSDVRRLDAFHLGLRYNRLRGALTRHRRSFACSSTRIQLFVRRRQTPPIPDTAGRGERFNGLGPRVHHGGPTWSNARSAQTSISSTNTIASS